MENSVVRAKAMVAGGLTGLLIITLGVALVDAAFGKDSGRKEEEAVTSIVTEETNLNTVTTVPPIQKATTTTTTTAAMTTTSTPTTTTTSVPTTTTTSLPATTTVEAITTTTQPPKMEDELPEQIIPKRNDEKEIYTTTSTTDVAEIPPVSEDMWQLVSNNSDGPILTPEAGRIVNADGFQETYYNLDMSGVLQNMWNLGLQGDYSVRSDGVKCFGGKVMVAANLAVYQYGDIVNTSLGEGIVVDTGTGVQFNQLDIAVAW